MEFGAKLSIAVMAEYSWLVGSRTFKGNLYDGTPCKKRLIKSKPSRIASQRKCMLTEVIESLAWIDKLL